MKPVLRTVLIYVLLGVLLGTAYLVLSKDGLPHETRSTFEADLARGNVAQVDVDSEHELVVRRLDGSQYETDVRYDDETYALLQTHDLEVGWYTEPERDPLLPTVFILVFAVTALAVLVRWARKAQGGGMLALQKSTARLLAQLPTTKWEDVGGLTDTKRELQEFVHVLKNRDVYRKAGARPVRGILLEGPPGYGKTLCAKALAADAGVPYFEVSATEFVELFVGVGAARIRDLFDSAKKKAPAVIFIDEIDALGRKRSGAGALTSHQEREQALNQLLVSMDGFADRDGVLVLAATNRAEILDPALLRPGRFDRVLRVAEYNDAEREEVLRIHSRALKQASPFDFSALAKRAAGLSGASIENACNRAATVAVHRSLKEKSEPAVLQADLEDALHAERPREDGFDELDLLLAEAALGLTHPAEPLHVAVTLDGGQQLSGKLVWIDPMSLKIHAADGAKVLSRSRIQWLSSSDAAARTAYDHIHSAAQTVPDVG